MSNNKLKSLKAVLLNSFYNWAINYNYPIHIYVINSIAKNEFLTKHENKDSLVVLNISPSAIGFLDITDTSVSFSTKFSGIDTYIEVPLVSLFGITYPPEKNDGNKLFQFPTQSLFDFKYSNVNIDKNTLTVVNNEKEVNKTNVVDIVKSKENNIIDISSRFKKKDN
jgi:stringent starvation protein B